MARTASDELRPPPEAARSARRSPLEVLHPDGRARGVLVCGSGPEKAVAGAPWTGDSPADLVLLAPSRSERRDAGWVREAGRIASALAQDGMVVATHPSRRLRGELASLGLERRDRLLHLPDVARSRYVFPLRGEAARYALRRLVPLNPFERAVARALAVPGTPSTPPTSLLFRRPGARPLLEWMDDFAASAASCAAVVAQSWRPTGATVVHRFSGGPAPDAIAKIGGGAAREAAGLRIAAGHSARHAEVPVLLGEGLLGDAPVVVQAPLRGLPATRLLRRSPRSAARLLRAIARWLEGWNRASATRRGFGEADGKRFVMAPARRLAPRLDDGESYLARLRRLCDRCLGEEVPFVDAHNDLTAANVLVDGDKPAIVDWEEAEAHFLPLGDLAYAAADFVAAADEYRDRPAAFAACFEESGFQAGLTKDLLRDAAASNGIEPHVAELCLHACWLHHADNEQHRSERAETAEEPFLAILRRVAAGAIARPA